MGTGNRCFIFCRGGHLQLISEPCRIVQQSEHLDERALARLRTAWQTHRTQFFPPLTSFLPTYEQQLLRAQHFPPFARESAVDGQRALPCIAPAAAVAIAIAVAEGVERGRAVGAREKTAHGTDD